MTDSISILLTLPNIGKTLAEKLVMTGVNSPQKLQQLGSESVFIRIRAIDNNACYNMLCALEGAVQGIRWHNLGLDRKRELKEFYKQVAASDR